MTFLPPDRPPPVLLSLDFGHPPADLALPPETRLVDGRLRLAAEQPDVAAGAHFGGVSFRDTIFEVLVRLHAGDGGDSYGVFVRRATNGRYVSCTISPEGVLGIRHFNGTTFDDVAVGDLAQGMSFAPGLDQANLFQVVACGPQLTFILNEMVLMGVTVQPGLAEGELGIFVQHGATSPAAVVEAEWTQVRAVLPPARRAG